MKICPSSGGDSPPPTTGLKVQMKDVTSVSSVIFQSSIEYRPGVISEVLGGVS